MSFPLLRTSLAALLFCVGLLPAPGQAPAEAPPPAPSVKEHRLQAGDVITVQVFGESELDLQGARLTAGGKVTMQLVGEISLGGLTATGASEAIAARLRQGYLVRPSVTVVIGDSRREQFTILGAVGKQGPYYFPPSGKLTLVEAVASAGGFTRIAKQTNLKVTRTANGREEEFTLDLKNDPAAKSFAVRPGDVITIKESLF